MIDDLPDELREGLAARYELHGVVGRGGMATVYAARDLRHQRQVAIKVLSADESAARGTTRFLREIRVAAGLSHPHILPVFDSGEVGDRLFFVMPLVEGESLRDRLRQDGTLPHGEALRIARDIADALAHAHATGVVHRDVKPENIMLAHGHALLADFGVARSANHSQGATVTQTGTAIGTPDYMSPEQLLGEDSVGPASDIYALGCVLFEMLTGAPPHQGAHLQALLSRRLSGPPSVRRTRPDVSHSVERTLTRALAVQPDDRFPSAVDFARALAETGTAEARARAELSLVVRPFDAVGGSPELTFFSDGLTEEVIGDLSKVHTLRVISRTSAMRLKGTPLDVRSIGREYDVRYVVSGSVRTAGNRVRVATEIADAVLDAPVWSGKFDGSMDDPFTAQEVVARGIVDALRLSLTPEEQQRIAERPIADPRAYDCYRRAMLEIVGFSREGLQRAESLLKQGLGIAGDNAQLFAGLGMVHWQYVNAGHDVREERVTEAMHWLERALALDPGLADAHAGLAWIRSSRGDMPAALRDLERALASEPTHSLSLSFYAVLDWLSGRTAHLSEMTTRLQAIDPWELWGVVMAGCERALAKDRAGRDAYFQRALAISESAIVLLLYGIVLAQNGELDGARAAWSRVGDPAATDLMTSLCVAGVDAIDGRSAAASERLATPTCRALIERDPQWAWHAATVLAIAGLNNEAVELIGLAVRQGFSNVAVLESRDASLAALRSDRRFPGLVALARQNAQDLERSVTEFAGR